MIYVEEKSLNRQIELISFLSELTPVSICAWLYPESRTNTLFDVPVVRSDLEPVTTYENGFVPYHTQLTDSSDKVLENIKSSTSALELNCDSLALYGNGSDKWVVATIGHEGMCLVRDDNLYKKLQTADFPVSKEAPSWW